MFLANQKFPTCIFIRALLEPRQAIAKKNCHLMLSWGSNEILRRGGQVTASQAIYGRSLAAKLAKQP